jgi:hypothetical protein
MQWKWYDNENDKYNECSICLVNRKYAKLVYKNVSLKYMIIKIDKNFVIDGGVLRTELGI